ncbi:hypothetical protein SLE2022_377240 [Rubroshorea leprosula]
MGSKHVLQKQKLELLDIIKEAMFIPVRNINFFLFIIITSFPLFCLLVSSEILLQSTFTEISHTLNYQPSFHVLFIWPTPFDIITNLGDELLYRLVQLSLLYLVPLHLLEFCSAFMTINVASDIYTEERKTSLKEIVQKPIHKEKLRAAFITSLYAHFLSTSTLLGLMWLVTTYYAMFWNSVVSVFLAVFHGAAFVALLMKYMEWSAAWKMSVVISIVEEKYGMDALVISDYFNSGSERRGLFLMLFFYGWDFVIRAVSLYWNGIMLQVCFFCLCNMMKWMASMVYFYDCKSRVLEKELDEEMGKRIKGIDEQSSLARE